MSIISTARKGESETFLSVTITDILETFFVCAADLIFETLRYTCGNECIIISVLSLTLPILYGCL
jgi:hypothetical protein